MIICRIFVFSSLLLQESKVRTLYFFLRTELGNGIFEKLFGL